MYHHMRDHHGPFEHESLPTHCLCGDAMNSSVHERPPCDWCDDGHELGAPAPWWHRMWCRFCAWWLLDKPK